MRTSINRVVLLCAVVMLGSCAMDAHNELAAPDQPEPVSKADAARRGALKSLEPWVGVDLRLIPERDRKAVDRATERLSWPESSRNGWGDLDPWYLWKISEWHGGDQWTAWYVFLEVRPLIVVPGGSSARATVLDENGRVLGQTLLRTGWRAEPYAAVLDRIYDEESECTHTILQINSEPDAGGAFTRQYYGMVDHEFRLLRLEDGGGKSLRNFYVAPNIAFGPEYAPDSVEDCVTLLRSGDRLVRLQALAWLAGYHRTRDHLHPMINSEPLDSEEPNGAIVANDCQASAEIKTELQRLAGDERDLWTAQAAAQALEPKWDDD